MAERGEGWRLAAPAKLNLWLAVVGRRADGYHQLESVLVLLDLADEVRVHAGATGLLVGGQAALGVPTGGANLAWRGWEAGCVADPPEWGIELDKQVAVAAGLGGGSSDAAAGWRLARRVQGQPDDPPDAATLGLLAAIGADVPFFAAGAAAARVSGIGEHVAPLPGPEVGSPESEVVLIHSPFGLSTAAVFGELRAADWSSPDSAAPLAPGRNDLLAPARRLRPELEDVFRVVAAAGGEPHLTGSGPTVFILTDDPERAAGVARRVERAGLTASETRLRREPASIEPW